MNTFLQRLGSLAAVSLLSSAAFSQALVTESNLNGWEKKQNQSGSAGFIKGPMQPPLGSSSASFTLGSTGQGQASMTSGELYKKKPLNQLTELKYCTYVQHNSTGNKTPFMVLSVVSKDGNKDKFDDLYFEPALQKGMTITKGTWQTWDAMNGYWWSKSSAAGATKETPKTLSAIRNAIPGLTLVNAHAIQLSAGAPVAFPQNSWNNFSGSFDNVKIGFEGTSTTYNFELDCGAISVSCPSTISVATDPGFCSAAVKIEPAAASGGCGNVTVVGIRNDGQPISAPYPKGTTTITWTATEGSGAPVSCTQTISVKDMQAPVLNLPSGIAPYSTVKRGTAEGVCTYTVQGSEFDATAWDNCDEPSRGYTLSGATTTSGFVSSSTLAGVVLNKGVTVIEWKATDAAGNQDKSSFSVHVFDDEAPLISNISATPNVLWSPNHKMTDVELTYEVTDNCGSVSYNVYHIDSNEPINGLGDGHTEIDWQIVNAHLVRLRAERSGKGDGRIYAIIIRATDEAGNVSYASVAVTVPHSQAAQANIMTVTAAPNPSSTSFTLNVKSSNTTDNIVMVVSNSHGLIMETRENLHAGETIILGDKFEKGVYFVSFKQGKSVTQIQLLKL